MPRKTKSREENSSGTNLKRVAGVQEIKPGQRKVVLVNGSEVLLLNLDGNFLALGNRCPHADFPLARAPISGDMIVCLNHGWMFNVKTGEGITKHSCSLTKYKVIVEGKDVKIQS
ncbi:MAG: Rieske (2Fe-2S) protein [Thermodesulfobacteriota bacterium]